MRRPRRVLRPACLAALAVLACAPGLGAVPASADSTDGTLSVTVGVDVDGDGSYDAETDGRQPGILITVSDAAGNAVTGSTDEDGQFVVEPTQDLEGGRYFVTAQVPDELAVTPVPPGESFAPFSSTVDVSGGSQAVTLGVVAGTPAEPSAAAPSPATGPSGVVEVPDPAPRPAVEKPLRFAVGDRVWTDTDGDGRQDQGERGRGGVSVQLLDDAGRVLDSTTSDSAGRYLFDDLRAGTYAVRFAGLTSGWKISPARQGEGRAADSDPDYTGVTPFFTLGRGESDVRPADSRDGVRADHLNATIDVGVAPLRFAIASTVWQDRDADGLLDPAEPAGRASVDLLRGADVVATTTTDDQGRYRFTGLSEGSYRVRFDDLGAHRLLTRPRVGSNRAVDSAPDPASRTSEVVRLAQGTADLVPGLEFGDLDADFVLTTLNAGTVGSYSITNRVWRDLDGNGLLDPDEPGVPDVVVELLDAAGDVLATTRTGASGRFSFNRLIEGEYRLRFPELPPGLHFTTPRAGGDADSDVYGDALTAPVRVGADNPVETQVAAGLTTSSTAAAGSVAPASASASPTATPSPIPAAALAGGGSSSPALPGAVALLVAAAGAGIILHARFRRP